MARCERLKKCVFLNDQMEYLPRTAEELKNSYCLRDNSACARHRIAAAGVSVPADLFPNETDRAETILRKAGMVSKSKAAGTQAKN
jgi:hypothetical protein